MKKLSLIFLIVVVGFYQLSAQDNTASPANQPKPSDTKETKYLLTGKKIDISGFIGIPFEFSQVQKEMAVSCGLNIAALFNQSFFLGLYGTSLSTNHYRLDLATITGMTKPQIEFYHAGLYTGYIFAHHQVFHFGIAAKLGYGQIYLSDGNHYRANMNTNNTGIDNVLVLSPQIELELNMTKFMKVNAFIGYRMLSGVDKKYEYFSGLSESYYKTSDYNSLMGGISLHFGFFGSKTNSKKEK